MRFIELLPVKTGERGENFGVGVMRNMNTHYSRSQLLTHWQMVVFTGNGKEQEQTHSNTAKRQNI